MAFQQQDSFQRLNKKLARELDAILTSASGRIRWEQRVVAAQFLLAGVVCAVTVMWSMGVSHESTEVLYQVPPPKVETRATSWDSSFCTGVPAEPRNANASLIESLADAYQRSFELRYCADKLRGSGWELPNSDQRVPIKPISSH